MNSQFDRILDDGTSKNLKEFDISSNPELKTAIINFERSTPISNCNFSNTNILCYEENTCQEFSESTNENIDDIETLNPDKIIDIEIREKIEKVIESKNKKNKRICTEEEIDKVLNSMREENEMLKNKANAKSIDESKINNYSKISSKSILIIKLKYN
ncbi:hypothetical protein PIROE2DRAFT_19242 [Piromyces sp. E2]|nr:hypothetical protein PIROE2DRAFT_19242 [Piromyces sp. E2]|eukprot:OUM56233.1 hypothetical protein PIROE2DRAFT_19242 [Piromyces sp. E2]